VYAQNGGHIPTWGDHKKRAMTRRVHHNKYFTFSYEGEQYRGIFRDRYYSFMKE
jgi:hypothetical protein